MAASNYTIFKADDVTAFKFGSTEWSEADMASITNALDTTFASNNASPLIDLVGTQDANSPVKSEAWCKSISITGNERQITEEDLLGKDASGAQNKEVVGGSVSRLTCEAMLVYRNNVPLSLFRDNTKCALIVMDNSESTTTGVLNIACNNITVTHVGGLQRNADGLMEQKITFTFAGGTVGAPIAVSQSSPSETWSKVRGSDYAEEVRLT